MGKPVELETCSAEGDFRGLIEHSPDGVVVCRGEEILYVNPRLVEMLDYAGPEVLVGRALSFLVHPEERRNLERFANQGDAFQHTPRTFRLRRGQGGGRSVEVLQCPVRYAEQPAVVLFARDITERQQLMSRAVQMDRTIAVGTLASGVSHEINNPLAFVSANLEYALHEIEWLTHQLARVQGGEPMQSRLDEVRQALNEAREGADRVRGVVSDLRLLSREAEGHPRSVAPARILDSAIQLTRNELRHRARVERDYQPSPPVVVDEGRLSQVFLNLLLNAAHAIPEGGFDENRVTLRVLTGDREVIIEVEDTGQGVPPELAERIFEPFFTTKPMGAGTGMGLSLSRNIVVGMGGSLTYHPAEGGGSVFRVVLPSGLVGETTLLPSTPHVVMPRGQVLIIDDEPLVGRSLRRMLSDEHEVQAVTSARAGIEILDAGKAPDVILCDVMMPDMSGMAFYALLEERHPELVGRLIFITGEAFTPESREFIEHIALPCLDKPVSPQVLRRAIRKLMGERLSLP